MHMATRLTRFRHQMLSSIGHIKPRETGSCSSRATSTLSYGYYHVYSQIIKYGILYYCQLVRPAELSSMSVTIDVHI